jgi:hypothetical protein
MTMIDTTLARRQFLKGTGALVIGFALASCNRAQSAAGQNALKIGPYGPPEDEIDSWISISSDGTTMLYTGCCEVGTGSSTGLPTRSGRGRRAST